MCLGGYFAKLEVRIVVARLFQKHKLEIADKRTQKFPMMQLLSGLKLSERAQRVVQYFISLNTYAYTITNMDRAKFHSFVPR